MKRCLQNLARICISIFEVNFSPFTLKVWVFASRSQAETQLAGGRAQQTSRFLQKKCLSGMADSQMVVPQTLLHTLRGQ